MFMNPQPIGIGVILNNVIEEGLKVEEYSQCFLRNVFYVVKLLKTVFLDIVCHVDGESFVEMRDITCLLRHQV